MTTYNVIGVFPVTGADRKQLEGSAGNMMEQLLGLENAGCGIHSSAVSVDLDANTVEVEVSVDAASEETVLGVAQSSMRAAIHATGAATAGWEGAPARLNTELVTA